MQGHSNFRLKSGLTEWFVLLTLSRIDIMTKRKGSKFFFAIFVISTLFLLTMLDYTTLLGITIQNITFPLVSQPPVIQLAILFVSLLSLILSFILRTTIITIEDSKIIKKVYVGGIKLYERQKELNFEKLLVMDNLLSARGSHAEDTPITMLPEYIATRLASRLKTYKLIK